MQLNTWSGSRVDCLWQLDTLWWCVGNWRWRRDVCRRSRSQLSAAASRRPPPTLVRHARPRRAHLLGRGTPTRAHSPHSCTLTPDTPITYSLHPVPVLLSRTFVFSTLPPEARFCYEDANKSLGSGCKSFLLFFYLSSFCMHLDILSIIHFSYSDHYEFAWNGKRGFDKSKMNDLRV